MFACPRCAGFVPEHLRACPNCDSLAGCACGQPSSDFRALRAHGSSRWARAGQALLGFTGLITLAACYGAPPPIDTCYDQDGDGYFPACYDDEQQCDPEDVYCDCADVDPYTNPGEIDTLGDGIDRDCDGADGQRPGGPFEPEQPFADAAVGWADATPL